MKKILSFSLAIVMMFSLFMVNVNAETAATYKVSYLNTDGTVLDTSTLAKDSLFLIKVELNNISTMLGADIALSWDKNVLAVVDKNGALAESTAKIAAYTTERGKNTIKEEYEETFLSESAALYPDQGRAEYTLYVDTVNTLLSTDNTVAVYRFKVVGTGNANVALVGKVDEGQGAGAETVSSSNVTVPSLTIAGGSTGGDKVEKAVQATTSYKTGMTGVLFTAVDGTNRGQYVVRFNGTVEAGDVKVGLKVTGVPSTNNLTITAENYYGTAPTGVLE